MDWVSKAITDMIVITIIITGVIAFILGAGCIYGITHCNYRLKLINTTTTQPEKL